MKQILFFLIYIVLFSCTDSNTKQGSSVTNAGRGILKADLAELGTDFCSNADYSSILIWNDTADKNAYTLIVTNKETRKKQNYTLDLPAGKTIIRSCNKNYTELWYFCGGPCHTSVFVFHDIKDRIETFEYCKIASTDSMIIVCYKNEDFNNLIIHSFYNHREIPVSMCNCEESKFSPCHMDSLYIIGENLILEYDKISKNPKQKAVNISLLYN